MGAGSVNFFAGALYFTGGVWSSGVGAVSEDAANMWSILGTAYGAFGAFLLFVSMLQLTAGSFLPFRSAERPLVFLMMLATGVLGIVAELLGWYLRDLGPFGWYCLAASILLIPVSMRTYAS